MIIIIHDVVSSLKKSESFEIIKIKKKANMDYKIYCYFCNYLLSMEIMNLYLFIFLGKL